ncbi:unnamed protein product [Musa acuminata var. zebrina]
MSTSSSITSTRTMSTRPTSRSWWWWSARYIQWRLHSHPPHERPLAGRIRRRCRPCVLGHTVRYVLIRGRPGQEYWEEVEECSIVGSDIGCCLWTCAWDSLWTSW